MEIAHVFNFRAPAERVHQVHATAARKKENVFYSSFNNALRDIIGELHHVMSNP